MVFAQLIADSDARRTGLAFISSKILKTPFWAIYSLLPVILYKDLHATPFQVALMIGLKPMVSILSIYWSANLHLRPDRLLKNIIVASVVGLLPFFFFPFIDNVWFFIAAFGFHMMLHRGVLPAWMEILKLNLTEEPRKKIFAYGSALGYLGDAVFPFFIGYLMDEVHQSWRWIFPCTALISLLTVFFQCRIPLPAMIPEKADAPIETWKDQLKKPWLEAYQLLKERLDFSKFQLGYMLGGGGLMLGAASTTIFFVDELQLTYSQLAVALAFCKGVGFVAATPLWMSMMSHINIYRMSSYISAAAALYFVILLMSPWHFTALYAAYLCYGIMQAGSEMNWNLSGPYFAGNQDSTGFSRVNVLTVGLRGCIVPLCGATLCEAFGSSMVILMSAAVCLFGAMVTALFSRSCHQEFKIQ